MANDREYGAALRASDRLAVVGAVLAEFGLAAYFVPSNATEPLFWALHLGGIGLATAGFACACKAYRITKGRLANGVRIAAALVLAFDIFSLVAAFFVVFAVMSTMELWVEAFKTVLSSFE